MGRVWNAGDTGGKENSLAELGTSNLSNVNIWDQIILL
jgi:hypothetical protein